MYIPNSMPSTLAEMLAFLQPCVQTGLFDSVAYDDDSNPTKIVCTQALNVILEITEIGGSFAFTPYIASGTAATGYHCIQASPITEAYRCSGGVYFKLFGQYVGFQGFVIAKTNTGKTGFISTGIRSNSLYDGDPFAFYLTSFGDNASAQLFTNPYLVYINYNNRVPYDRTILLQLPVVGASGSTGYFQTAFIRNCVQFYETGNQMIGGVKYCCADCFAILDT